MLIKKDDWIISNVTRDPLTFLDILFFKIRGDNNTDSNLSESSF